MIPVESIDDVRANDVWFNDQVKPKNTNEQRYWTQNLNYLPETIKKGFIDPKKLPPLYPWSKRIYQALWLAGEKLNATTLAPNAKNVSLRVYRDWKSFVKQMQINLRYSV
jgi:hypothetical protein